MKFSTLIIFIFSLSIFAQSDVHLFVNFTDHIALHTHKSSRLSCPSRTLKNLDPDIIFIGENHFDGFADEFVLNNISTFKELGFEHFFAEYIETRDQRVLDRFNADPVGNMNQLYRTFGMEGDWGYDTSKYLSLSAHVAKAGINIMGLDRRYDLMFMIDRDKKMEIRDRHMFEVAERFILNNPGKKLIFFNGWAHSFINDRLTAPSFYELFVERFPNLKVVNLKRDFYDEMSDERLGLANDFESLSRGCKSEFVFYEGDDSSFDYYVFEQDKPLLPISDSYATDFI